MILADALDDDSYVASCAAGFSGEEEKEVGTKAATSGKMCVRPVQ